MSIFFDGCSGHQKEKAPEGALDIVVQANPYSLFDACLQTAFLAWFHNELADFQITISRRDIDQRESTALVDDLFERFRQRFWLAVDERDISLRRE